MRMGCVSATPGSVVAAPLSGRASEGYVVQPSSGFACMACTGGDLSSSVLWLGVVSGAPAGLGACAGVSGTNGIGRGVLKKVCSGVGSTLGSALCL